MAPRRADPPPGDTGQVGRQSRQRRRSTGPRTYRGKCAVRLNALRHGAYASPKFFRTYLIGAREDVDLYDWISSGCAPSIAPGAGNAGRPPSASREAWCQFRMLRIVGIGRGWRIPTRSSIWCRLRGRWPWPRGMSEQSQYMPWNQWITALPSACVTRFRSGMKVFTWRFGRAGSVASGGRCSPRPRGSGRRAWAPG